MPSLRSSRLKRFSDYIVYHGPRGTKIEIGGRAAIICGVFLLLVVIAIGSFRLFY